MTSGPLAGFSDNAEMGKVIYISRHRGTPKVSVKVQFRQAALMTLLTLLTFKSDSKHLSAELVDVERPQVVLEKHPLYSLVRQESFFSLISY